jgi:CheY-like chemotaxis protein
MEETPLHILLVDDERISREVETHLLRSGGCTVTSASLPSEALDTFLSLKDQIDVVVLDMLMPEMNGKDLFIKLQQIKPGVKAVLLSGYGENKDILEVLNRGMYACMQKPVSRQELLSTVFAAAGSEAEQQRYPGIDD